MIKFLIVTILLIVYFIYYLTYIKKHIYIYCINLKDNTSRKQNILDQYKQHKLTCPITFIDAIDTRGSNWAKYSDHITEHSKNKLINAIKYKKRLEHQDLTTGSIGCFLSHLKIYNIIKNKHHDSDYILILEDDNIFNNNFNKELNIAINRAPTDWDIILLCYNDFSSTPVVNNKYYKKTTKFHLTNCYLIRKQSVNKILNHYSKIYNQFDSYLSDLARQNILNIYTYNTKLSKQGRHFKTNIQNINVK